MQVMFVENAFVGHAGINRRFPVRLDLDRVCRIGNHVASSHIGGHIEQIRTKHWTTTHLLKTNSFFFHFTFVTLGDCRCLRQLLRKLLDDWWHLVKLSCYHQKSYLAVNITSRRPSMVPTTQWTTSSASRLQHAAQRGGLFLYFLGALLQLQYWP